MLNKMTTNDGIKELAASEIPDLFVEHKWYKSKDLARGAAASMEASEPVLYGELANEKNLLPENL